MGASASNPAPYQQTGSSASQSIYGASQQQPNPGGDALNSNSKKNAPPPPNYIAASEAQGHSGQQAAQSNTVANRPNQVTGFGSNTWQQNPDGSWTQNTSLNPTLGGALSNLQNTAAANSANGASTIAGDRNAAIASNYAQIASRLDPQWNQRAEQMQSQLVNQGLDPSSQAYQNAMLSFNQGRNDAYSSAINNAIGLGNQTEGVDLQAQFAPYQQLGALQGFQNGLPGFNAATPWAPTQYLPAAEAAGGYGLQAQQLNNQANQATWNDAAQLGQTAAMASDERIKSHIKRLPVNAAPGIPLATFKYKHAPEQGHHLGVIAQDVEKVQPHNVQTGPDGIKRVNYGALGLKPHGGK